MIAKIKKGRTSSIDVSISMAVEFTESVNSPPSLERKRGGRRAMLSRELLQVIVIFLRRVSSSFSSHGIQERRDRDIAER